MAAGCEAAAALWEALYGNSAAAREHASSTFAQSNGRDARYVAAFALASIGDSQRARAALDNARLRRHVVAAAQPVSGRARVVLASR